MANYRQSFDELAEGENAIKGLVAFAGFTAPLTLQITIESSTSFDTYDELYAVFAIVTAEIVAGDYKRYAQGGAFVYLVDQLADRFGVKQKLYEVLGGA